MHEGEDWHGREREGPSLVWPHARARQRYWMGHSMMRPSFLMRKLYSVWLMSAQLASMYSLSIVHNLPSCAYLPRSGDSLHRSALAWMRSINSELWTNKPWCSMAPLTTTEIIAQADYLSDNFDPKSVNTVRPIEKVPHHVNKQWSAHPN